MLELEGILPEVLADELGGKGRAHHVWEVLARGDDPYVHASLAAAAQSRLIERTRPTIAAIEARDVAQCETTKLRLGLHDGASIETVVLPSEARTTVCVSTQVGCARGCIFCVTATMGLKRGLTPGEIVAQVVLAIREARDQGFAPVRNVVFMGMGEPLDNLDAVKASIDVLCDPKALALAPSHVTLSTVGTSREAVLDTRELDVRIAWSLHAADEGLRRRLVPTAKEPPEALRDAFAERSQATDSPLFVEIALIDRINDELEHADAVADFFQTFPTEVRVNLLPMNQGRDGLMPSPPERAVAFRQRVRERGLFCAIRKTRGADKSAACGQLATSPG